MFLLLAGCGAQSPSQPAGDAVRVSAEPITQRQAAQCALGSALLTKGRGFDAPGRPAAVTELPARDVNVSLNSGSCASNTSFNIGSGIADITGNAGNSITVGYENLEHVTQGIHSRLYARAFAAHSPCNGKRVLMAVVDNAFITQAVRQGVLDMVADDAEMSGLYGPDNIMLSATHTHSTPGGDSHDNNHNFFRLGYDPLGYTVYTQGIFTALRSAHRNLQSHATPGRIGMSSGELLDTNINRSPEAYAINPEPERSNWLDVNGDEVKVNKTMRLIRFIRDDGSQLGFLNWFGVHTVSLGIHVPAIGSDNKGYAALAAERIMNTGYGLTEGENTFVAAFAQEDEGDSSPNLCVFEFPFPDQRLGCGVDTLEGNAISGSKQLAKALQLYDTAETPLQGGIDYRLMHIDMNDVTVTDPVVLDSLQHPPELDTPVKRTCTAGLGVSFGAGAEDNRGRTEEGVSCSDPDQVEQASNDFASVINSISNRYPNVPPFLLSNAVCAGNPARPNADYSCQAEKPVLLPAAIPPLPLQVFTIGNLAIVALPWEVTTTSARRLRQQVLHSLASGGIDSVVIAGLSNDYAQYMSTREEYSSQQYEGASTLFGPWQLAAVTQEVLKLTASLRDGTAAPEGAPAPRTSPTAFRRLPFVIADTPLPSGSYGSVLQDVQPMYLRSETAVARFQGGHPRNDTLEKLELSYAYAERQRADGSWEIIAQDRDLELQFRWFPTPSTDAPTSTENEVSWTLPGNLAPGIYRLRHVGTARSGAAAPFQSYEGVSSSFEVLGPAGACPNDQAR